MVTRNVTFFPKRHFICKLNIHTVSTISMKMSSHLVLDQPDASSNSSSSSSSSSLSSSCSGAVDKSSTRSRRGHRMCRYCFERKEPPAVYSSHFMFRMSGVAECPRMRADGCAKCGANGDMAHYADMCRPPVKLPARYRSLFKAKLQKKDSLRIVLLKKLTYKLWMEKKDLHDRIKQQQQQLAAQTAATHVDNTS